MQRSFVSFILAGPLALICAVTLFSGCKADTGKENRGPSAQASVTVPVDNRKAGQPVIVCFGNSLTAGYGTEASESYPDALQKMLDAQGYPYRVLNEGVSGNTTKDGVDRINRVLARKPQIVVLEFGGNDGLRGLPLAQTELNMGIMISRLQAAGATVALAGITLPPDYGPDYIAKFNAMYPALAKKYHIPYLPFLLKGAYGVAGDMQDDGIHATAKGNQQVAANVEHLIHPLLKR